MLQRGVRADTEVRIDTISFVFSAVAIQRTLKLKRKIVTSKIRYETKEYRKYMPKKIMISFAFPAVANGNKYNQRMTDTTKKMQNIRRRGIKNYVIQNYDRRYKLVR